MFGETKGEKELITNSKDRIPKDNVERQESGGQPRPLTLPSQMPASSSQDGGMSKKNIEPEDNLVYAIAENKEDSDHESSTPPRLVSRMSLPSLPFVRKVLSSAGVPKEIQYDVKLHPISLVEPSTPTKSEDEVAMQCLYTHVPHSQLSIMPQNPDEDEHTSKLTRRGCRHKERHKLGPPHSQSRDASAEIAPELFSDDERGRTRSHERKHKSGDREKCRKCNRPKKPKEDQNAAKEPTR
ncbi:unnamed protein product [Hermetia illucens]|uniref:Uncharacterized protein n=1 Tax=Hermetia illucens TaxID=343691 RepID=A0A7R8UA64_HERIL|nr:unnamed protein product [Hermetia illucens]